jgi:hypothetical protein
VTWDIEQLSQMNPSPKDIETHKDIVKELEGWLTGTLLVWSANNSKTAFRRRTCE